VFSNSVRSDREIVFGCFSGFQLKIFNKKSVEELIEEIKKYGKKPPEKSFHFLYRRAYPKEKFYRINWSAIEKMKKIKYVTYHTKCKPYEMRMSNIIEENDNFIQAIDDTVWNEEPAFNYYKSVDAAYKLDLIPSLEKRKKNVESIITDCEIHDERIQLFNKELKYIEYVLKELKNAQRT
jgi:hypothetical protein